MIFSERQYSVSQEQLNLLRSAVDLVRADPEKPSWLRELERSALESQIGDIEQELDEYASLKSGDFALNEAISLEELPRMLIRARIAKGLSQTQLAAKLELKPQQIQRYEASNYMGARLSRLVDVAAALGVRVSITFADLDGQEEVSDHQEDAGPVATPNTFAPGTLQEGQVVDGVVKNITDYGAFVDLGGIDGLLHVTDMAWRRVNHPSEILNIGQQVKVQIIRINQETHRISLGMKQLESDPWDGISAKYPVGKKISGTVTNITDYGAFVELEPGIEGLIHISEMSWTKKNVHPGKILSTSQEVDVVVLEVDPSKRRISLGLKQTLENPWQAFAYSHPAGTEVEGEVKNKTEFGLFIGLEGDVDGMVHLSDLDWNRPGEQVIEEYNKGDVVKAVVLDVDVDKERISLGIKQLGRDAVGEAAASGELRKNAVVSCEVIAVNDGGVEVKLVNHEDITSFIRRNDLARDRDDQRPERFSVGQVFDARVVNWSKKDRKVMLSIKALEIAEEKEAVAQFGSSDSGASLGDILGAALKNRGGE
ncbi:ribosomal protein S1 [Neorhizobium sp. S3-V5DH]|nr:ribosomal protein S1 [Neorhizobium sp. S3-V5DH]